MWTTGSIAVQSRMFLQFRQRTSRSTGSAPLMPSRVERSPSDLTPEVLQRHHPKEKTLFDPGLELGKAIFK